MIKNSNIQARDFSKGSIVGNILRQSIPLFIAQFAALLYSTVDKIYLGHIENIGKEALTGIGLTFPIVSIISAFTVLFGLGGTPLFSISRGKGDEEKARKIMGNSFSLLCICSVIITLLCYVFASPVLYALGASSVTHEYAFAYLRIYLLGTPFLMIGTGMNSYISAQGFSLKAMITTLSGALINCVLDPLFIFIFGLGIKGAAIATIISQTISFLWVMYFFFIKGSIYSIKADNIKLSGRIVGNICLMGVTNFIMEATNAAVQLICNKSLSLLGGDTYVAIMTTVNSVRAIMTLLVSSMTAGSQPVISFNYGAKEYDRVKSGIKFNTIVGMAYTALAWLLIILFPAAFINLFTDDVEVVNIGAQYLNIYFMAFIFMALQFSGQTTFMALGKSVPAICFSLLRKVIIVVPLTLILPHVLPDPISGVFWAEPISNVLGGTACFVTMYFLVYRKIGKETKTA